MESNSASSQRSSETTTVIDKRTLIEALTSLKTELKNHTDVATENVLQKLETINEEIKSLNIKFNELDASQQAIEQRCHSLEQDKTMLVEEVRSLQVRLNDAEQHSRCANVEIIGIPETPEENVYRILQRLAAVLGVQHNREDVSIAHRLRLFSDNHAHAPIIAQFVSRSVKEQWLAAARKKRGLKSTDLFDRLQPCDVYVNDHLTVHNKRLLGQARKLQRGGKLHFAGYFNGKVLIKVQEKDGAVRVYCKEDLDKYEK